MYSATPALSTTHPHAPTEHQPTSFLFPSFFHIIMSSYADIAKHGPSQTDEEKRAPAVPELVDHTTIDTAPVTSDDKSINVVPADFKDQPVKTETQASQHDRDAELHKKKEEIEKKAKRAAKKTENVLLAVGKDVRTYNLIDSILLVTLGVVGYRKYRDGQLDLQTASIGVVGLGLFAGVQTFVQKWFSRQ